MVARSEGRHVGLPLHRYGVEIKLNHYRKFHELDKRWQVKLPLLRPCFEKVEIWQSRKIFVLTNIWLVDRDFPM